MLRFKPFLKVKPVLEHVAILNILTYLGTKPVSRFMSEVVTLTENMILVHYQLWKQSRIAEIVLLTYLKTIVIRTGIKMVL